MDKRELAGIDKDIMDLISYAKKGLLTDNKHLKKIELYILVIEKSMHLQSSITNVVEIDCKKRLTMILNSIKRITQEHKKLTEQTND